MVHGRGISRDNEWTIETLVETLNGKMGGGEKKIAKFKNFPNFSKEVLFNLFNSICRREKKVEERKKRKYLWKMDKNEKINMA